MSDEEIESVALARNISPSWHFIGHPKLKFQVYSAYFDDRLEIVGMNLKSFALKPTV